MNDRPFSRRTTLKAGLAFLTSTTRTFAEKTPERPDPLRDAAEMANAEVWRRFVDKDYGTLYDYAGLDGAVLLPTPEECRQSKPNALGWWTPIENGAFFGGLFLDGLCSRWSVRRDERSAADARRIAAGLVRLAQVGRTPGFIARGISTDGKSHYAAGSDDQTFPWFYGLWRYLRSGLPEKEERERLVALMKQVAVALEKAAWRMPCDDATLGFRGTWIEPNFIHAARLLFVLRAMADLTGERHWQESYHKRLAEKAGHGGETRLGLCARGALYQRPGSRTGHPDNPPFWTSASSQAALKALVELEDRPEVRAAFQAGLDVNARAAAEHVKRYRQFDRDTSLPFNLNWRLLNDLWTSQPSIDRAVEVAIREVAHWDRISPRRGMEASHMREPLFAAWVVVLSGNREIMAQVGPNMRQAILHFQWTDLYTSLFFITVNVYYQGISYGF